MKKKVFIDLNGIVFEPIDTKFSEIARQDFGPAKAMAVTMAYKYGIGRGMLKSSIARVLYKCARRPQVRPGALDALEKLAALPNVSIEFCGQIAFPEYAHSLEQEYRAIAPCMNAASHYELVSPFKSKRRYLCCATAKDAYAMNYILGTQVADMSWPAKWRIIPVLINNATKEEGKIKAMCGKRVFENLNAFQEFLARRR